MTYICVFNRSPLRMEDDEANMEALEEACNEMPYSEACSIFQAVGSISGTEKKAQKLLSMLGPQYAMVSRDTVDFPPREGPTC